MNTEPTTEPNVRQVVPFFRVTNMEESLRFYRDGLDFKMIQQWIDAGRLRWCWLQLGGAALMLQEFVKEGDGPHAPQGKLGEGVSLAFQCLDALAIYRSATGRGLLAQKPFVGNGMWVTVLHDPDGYVIEFESPTDTPEETEYHESGE